MTEVKRLFDLLPHYLENYPDQDAAFVSKHNGSWQKISIQEYVQCVNFLSYGLMHIGIESGDRVAIISSNRPEWNMLDMAVIQMGAISVPIYPTISQNDYIHILNHAAIKALFIEGKELKTKIEPIAHDIASLKFIYTFDKIQDDIPYVHQLMEEGKEHPNESRLKKIQESIDAMDMATIVYTSGTTGNPKGVMLSHNNIVKNFVTLSGTPAKWNKRALSFLPLCHAYERMLVYLDQYLGISVYYAESLATIAENIKEVDATFMSCVPRLLEKIYDRLYAGGRKLSFFQRSIYYWAFNLATKYRTENMSQFLKFHLKIADKLVYSKWRKVLGGHFDIVVSGGSALQPHIAAFFSAIGMPVFEGYGLTETSPVIAVMDRTPNGRRFGTVGHPLEGTEVIIGPNNEILCRGHNVMIGYYKDPEQTSHVIDEQGWFHTGDTGVLSEDNVLTVTGRLKNIFKTSFGKYINPEALESKMNESPFIENIVVFGENQKFAAALIHPDFTFLRAWCKIHKEKYTTPEEMVKNRVIIDRYAKEIKKYNANFGDWEQIKRFELISDDWSQNNVLTPTLKVKRNVIETRYADRIKKLFD